jgi:hypothetical protein
MRKLALALVLLSIPALAGAQTRGKRAGAPKQVPPPSAKVAVAGLRIVGPGVGPENDHQRPFNWSQGTTVVVAVKVAPPYALVEIDKDKSTLELADSQGTALDSPEVGWSPDFTKDGTAALVDLESKGLPAEGSSHVAAKGTLMFKAASGVRTVKAPGVKLEKGTPVKLGPTTTITISEMEPNEGSEDGPLVSFKSTRTVMKGIKALRAKDAKGAPIEVHWQQSGGFEEEYEMGYRLKGAGKGPVTFEFDLFDGLRDLPVAFDVKAGVGIPAQ